MYILIGKVAIISVLGNTRRCHFSGASNLVCSRFTDQWEQFLDPEVVRPSILSAAAVMSLIQSAKMTPIDFYYLHHVEDDGTRIEENISALAEHWFSQI